MALADILPLIGTGLGAAAGAAVGNPMLGAKIGTAAGSFGSSLINSKKGNEAAPPLDDPEERMLLDDLRRRAKSFETGSQFQAQKRALNQQRAAISRGIARASGGNSGSAIAGLNRLNRSTGTILNEIYGAGQQRQDFLNQQISSLVQNMAQRRLGIQSLEQDRSLAKSNRSQREGFAQILATLGTDMNLMPKPAAPDEFNGGYSGSEITNLQDPYGGASPWTI